MSYGLLVLSEVGGWVMLADRSPEGRRLEYGI